MDAGRLCEQHAAYANNDNTTTSGNAYSTLWFHSSRCDKQSDTDEASQNAALAATMVVFFAFATNDLTMCTMPPLLNYFVPSRTSHEHGDRGRIIRNAGAFGTSTEQTLKSAGWHPHCVTSCCTYSPQENTILRSLCAMRRDDCAV